MIVAVTGLIGAGKTTVCSMFEKERFLVISPDVLGHEVLETHAVKKKLISIFGVGIVVNGKVVRKQLAAKAFSSSLSRKKLHSITHPLLMRKLKCELQKNKRKKIIIDVALFNELGIQKLCDKVVLVRAKKSVREQRLLRNNKFTREQIRMREQHQSEPSHYDFLIDNNKTKVYTRKQVLLIIRSLH